MPTINLHKDFVFSRRNLTLPNVLATLLWILARVWPIQARLRVSVLRDEAGFAGGGK